MPITYGASYSANRLYPFVDNMHAIRRAFRVQASQSIVAGQAVAVATTGVNAVQTLTVSGSAGTYTITFRGYTTTAIAYNANAATIQAALEALPSIGTGNCAVASTGPWTLTFQGALASQPVELATASGTGGATASIAATTTGVFAGGLKAWNSSKIADPGDFAAFSISAAGTGTFVAGTYSVQAAWRNAQGSTLAGKATTLALSGSNAIRVAAINAANTPDDATYLDVYVNGILAQSIAVSTPGTGGNVVQTDVGIYAAGSGAPLPTVNTAWVATDGSHVFIGFSEFDCYTDTAGKVTLGQQTGGMSHLETLADVPVWVTGMFRIGDTTNANVAAITQTRVQVIGSSYSDAEALFRL